MDFLKSKSKSKNRILLMSIICVLITILLFVFSYVKNQVFAQEKIIEKSDLPCFHVDNTYYLDVPEKRLFAKKGSILTHVFNKNGQLKLFIEKDKERKILDITFHDDVKNEAKNLTVENIFKVEVTNQFVFLFLTKSSTALTFEDRILIANIEKIEQDNISFTSGLKNDGGMPISKLSIKDIFVTPNNIFFQTGDYTYTADYKQNTSNKNEIDITNWLKLSEIQSNDVTEKTDKYISVFAAAKNADGHFAYRISNDNKGNLIKTTADEKKVDILQHDGENLEKIQYLACDDAYLYFIQTNDNKVYAYVYNLDLTYVTHKDITNSKNINPKTISVIKAENKNLYIYTKKDSAIEEKLHHIKFDDSNKKFVYQNYYSKFGNDKDRLRNPSSIEYVNYEEEIHVFILDKGNNRMVRQTFDKNMNWKKNLVTIKNLPENSSIMTKFDNKIYLLSPEGKLYEIKNTSSFEIDEIAKLEINSGALSIKDFIIKENNIYVLTSNTIYQASLADMEKTIPPALPTIEIKKFQENTNNFTNIFLSENNIIYASNINDSSKIFKFIPTYKKDKKTMTYEKTDIETKLDSTSKINTLKIDCKGNIYIFSNDKIVYYDVVSEKAITQKTDLKSPKGIAFNEIIASSLLNVNNTNCLFVLNQGEHMFMLYKNFEYKNEITPLTFNVKKDKNNYVPECDIYPLKTTTLALYEDPECFDNIILYEAEAREPFLILDKKPNGRNDFVLGITKTKIICYIKNDNIDFNHKPLEGSKKISYIPQHPDGLNLYDLPLTTKEKHFSQDPQITTSKPFRIGNRTKGVENESINITINVLNTYVDKWNDDGNEDFAWYYIEYAQTNADGKEHFGSGYVFKTDLSIQQKPSMYTRLKVNSKQLGRVIPIYKDPTGKTIIGGVTDTIVVELLDLHFYKQKPYTKISYVDKNNKKYIGYIETEYLIEKGLTSMQRLSIILSFIFIIVTAIVVFIIVKNRKYNKESPDSNPYI